MDRLTKKLWDLGDDFEKRRRGDLGSLNVRVNDLSGAIRPFSQLVEAVQVAIKTQFEASIATVAGELVDELRDLGVKDPQPPRIQDLF